MRNTRSGWFAGLLAAAVVAGAADLSAQSTKLPSTARYGSGYIDVPVASVLPHLAITGTYGGYFLDVGAPPLVGANGLVSGFGAPIDGEFRGDGSVALGLFNRLEVGASLQQFGDAGDLYGFFGRLALIRPEVNQQGLGLAVGARYLTASEDGVQPGRIGLFDARVRDEYAPFAGTSTAYEGFDTELSPYVVGSAFLRGPEVSWLPKHDWTFTAGWGDGLFRDGDEFEWYSSSYSNGWFVGAASHIELGSPNRLLNLIGDYNGFDVNLGAQLDLGGFRVGAYVLGVNYGKQITEYRSQKFGVLGSVALCPAQGGLFCKASLLDRPEPEVREVRVTVPPDTVVVEREVAPALPTGTPTNICLATGETVQVFLTAQGDTLVGPSRVSIRTLRPGVVFAGSYAEGRDWFTSDAAIDFERASYSKSGGEAALQCGSIVRVGEHQGVPLFADSNANRPFQKLYVPVRPGVWQAYETGLQRTRGE